MIIFNGANLKSQKGIVLLPWLSQPQEELHKRSFCTWSGGTFYRILTLNYAVEIRSENRGLFTAQGHLWMNDRHRQVKQLPRRALGYLAFSCTKTMRNLQMKSHGNLDNMASLGDFLGFHIRLYDWEGMPDGMPCDNVPCNWGFARDVPGHWLAWMRRMPRSLEL